VRGRVALVCGGAVALSGAVLSMYAGAMAERLVGDEVARRGRWAATQLAMEARYGVSTGDRPLLAQLVDSAQAAGGSDVAGVAVRDATGRVLAQAPPAESVPAARPGTIGAPVAQVVSSTRGEVLQFSARVSTVGHSLGEVDVVVSPAPAREARTHVLTLMLLATAGLAVAAALAAAALAGSGGD
jgi:hypothetical protein